MSTTIPIVQVKNLSKEFKSGTLTVTALKDISLDIHQGEIFGIIGLSGAGKSTLVRCMNYLEAPTSGEVVFEGQSLTYLNEKHQEIMEKSSFHPQKYIKKRMYRQGIEKRRRMARQSMGMIFQQFNLLAQRTVLQNICFPLEIAGTSKKEAKKRAVQLLKLVGLQDKAKSYPAQLSGGQKQRVAIARALATNPKVLLCDEATSALDPNTTKSILQLLKEINKSMGVTIIVITHEMSVIESVCDRVAIIDQSRIAETGEVSRIFSEPKSKIGRQLILGEAVHGTEFGDNKKIRIIFDGRSSFEPVLSNLILACQVPINILYAATKDINGVAAGQMLIQLPEEEGVARRVRNYLKTSKICFEEVDGYDV